MNESTFCIRKISFKLFRNKLDISLGFKLNSNNLNNLVYRKSLRLNYLVAYTLNTNEMFDIISFFDCELSFVDDNNNPLLTMSNMMWTILLKISNSCEVDNNKFSIDTTRQSRNALKNFSLIVSKSKFSNLLKNVPRICSLKKACDA